ncbi:MAG: lipoyl(octanoyl) transferase LipB [Spirulina sp. SIO3F2]|nr:lipoyl(octanoyl) transferase LipB [Spirulina sp. SIO3F2]
MPQNLKAPLPTCGVYHLGIVPYRQAWGYQQQLHKCLVADPTLSDQLLLLEHHPVYTLGTGSSLAHVKFASTQSSHELIRTERGGEVTYHCPGQIVGYPILNLHRYRLDLHWYLRQLEAVIIVVLAKYGVQGERMSGLTGVWVEGYKVAAIGIKVKRWVTMHGFALNVCPDLTGFKQIVPCGIADRPVGSLAQFVPNISLTSVYQDLAIAFGQVMGCPVTSQIYSLPPLIAGTIQ